VLAARGEFEEAARRFQLALARKPDFIDAYDNLALACVLSVGQAGDALDALRRALAVGETTPSKALFVQCARSSRLGGFRGPAVVVNTGVGGEPRSAPASSRATARSWPW
jgi:Tfp pilus assembly protein PilF